MSFMYRENNKGDKMTKTGTVQLIAWNAFQESIFRTCRVQEPSHKQVFDQAKNVGAEVTFLTIYTFLR